MKLIVGLGNPGKDLSFAVRRNIKNFKADYYLHWRNVGKIIKIP